MSGQDVDKLVTVLEKIGKLYLFVHTNKLSDMEPSDQAERLSKCGFSNTEVAQLLGMTQNAVNVALHRKRQKSRPKQKVRK